MIFISAHNPTDAKTGRYGYQFAAKDKTSAYGLSHHVYDRVRNLSRDGLRVTAPLLEPSGRAAEGRARRIHPRDVTDCGECTGLEKGDPSQGTEGSNPSPSSAESGTNRRPRVKRPFWIVTRAGAVEIGDEVFFEIGGIRFSTSCPPLAR